MIQIGIVIGLFALAVLGYSRFEAILEERGSAKVALQVCKTDGESLVQTIEDTNTSLKGVVATEKARADAAELAVAAAKKEAEKNRQAALGLLARTIPQGKDACEASRDLIAEYAKGRGK